ncbi:14585_t:CDS:10, partial [Entrophospora sp. SA101]
MKKKILLKLGEIDNEIGVFNEFDEFLLKKSTKRLRIFSRILDICKELIISNVVATKRSVYYRDVNLFGNSERVDRAIDDLCCIFRVTGRSLNLIASAKGLISGDFKLFKNNQIILEDSINSTNLESEAKIIIVVEKEATFQTLLSNKIFQKLDSCMLITGKGYPDVATRQLIKLFCDLQPKIKILGFFDSDPHGRHHGTLIDFINQLHDYPETADKGFFVLLDALNEFCDTIEGITEDDVRASIIEWYSNTTVASTDIVRVK